MKIHWYNQNRNWIKRTVQLVDDKQPIKDMKVNPDSDVLMMLKYDSTIELKGLSSESRICIDLGATSVDFVLWGTKRLELSVFSQGLVFVIQVSADIDSWKIVHVWESHQNSSFYIGDELISPILLSLFKDRTDTIQRLNEALLDEQITSVCTLHNGYMIGTKSGGIYSVVGSDVQRLDSNHVDEVTVLKKVTEDRFVSAGKDSKVYLWRCNDNQEWECILLGQHTGWVYDCVVDRLRGISYTSGADGIVGVWDLYEACAMESIPVNEGVASCLTLVGGKIYVGHHLGKVVALEKQDDGQNQYHKNSIWNMFGDQERDILYSGGADGQILCTRISDGQLLNNFTLSNGWINGFDKSNQLGIVAVSSEGEILFLDRQETVKLNGYWFNNIKVHDDTNKMFVASAEGDIVVLDTESREIIVRLKGHPDQVMDILLDSVRNLIISISIDGTLIFWDLIHHKQIHCLSLIDFHPTSMVVCNNQLLIASLEGDVAFVVLDDLHIVNRKRLHHGRLWKISGCPQQNLVATVGTDRFLHLWDMDDLSQIASWRSDSLLTTCLLLDDKVFGANQNGEVIALQIEEEMDSQPVHFAGKNIVFVDGCTKSKASTQRVISILKDLHLDFTLYDVRKDNTTKEWVVNQSGWDRFPQVFFNGKFIGAGSVLYEMYRTKALKRLISKCYKEWNRNESNKTARR